MSALEGYDVIKAASKVAADYINAFYPNEQLPDLQAHSDNAFNLRSDVYIDDPSERLDRCIGISNTLIASLRNSSSDPKLQFLGIKHRSEIPNQTTASFRILNYDIDLVANSNVSRISISDGSRNLGILMAKVRGK